MPPFLTSDTLTVADPFIALALIGIFVWTLHRWPTRPRPVSRWAVNRQRRQADRLFDSIEEDRRDFEQRMP